MDLQWASASALFLAVVSILMQPFPANKDAPVEHTEKQLFISIINYTSLRTMKHTWFYTGKSGLL